MPEPLAFVKIGELQCFNRKPLAWTALTVVCLRPRQPKLSDCIPRVITKH